jgi:apolipoprotein N-acyltransferase
MKLPVLGRHLPTWKNALLAVLAAGLLILAFPDFEWWWTAWFALVPLMWAVERQKHCITACFLLGWLFGTVFFFGTCWWLAYAPIHYASFPPILAYSLILIACLGAGVFPGIFAAILAVLLKRFGSRAFLAAPFVWVACEFARYWITGNNWNAIGYSQFQSSALWYASKGGVLAVSFVVVVYNLLAQGLILLVIDGVRALVDRANGSREGLQQQSERTQEESAMFKPLNDGSDDDLTPFLIGGLLAVAVFYMWLTTTNFSFPGPESKIVAVQPDVPMSGLDQSNLVQLRKRQIDLAESALKSIEEERKSFSTAVPASQPRPTTVILPESPMNFMYSNDREFQQFIGDFARKNNVSVLFNSSEPDKGTTKYFNSAVMVGPDGKKVAEYDKIFLLPFGEAVPGLFDGLIPAFVGTFSYGSNYTMMPVGDGKAGVMICFESHFGQLSREYVRQGADVIIEMTNDGYLGPTPVLRQHLANAVFRAVETNRPVLRVTNVGISAYIDAKGRILDPTMPYQEDTRVWSVSRSDGSRTFYVEYGDWFAWLCSIVTVFLIVLSGRKRKAETRAVASVT